MKAGLSQLKWHSRALTGILTAVLLVTTPTFGLAHSNKRIDDACTYPGTGLFVATGYAGGWGIHTGALKAYGSCHMYTTTVTGDVVNAANYYLPISSTYDGDYYLWAYIACETTSDHWWASDARYRRYRNGSANGVTETYSINQYALSHAGSCTSSTSTLLTATGSSPPTYDNWNGSNAGYTKMIDKSTGASVYISADMLDYIAKH